MNNSILRWEGDFTRSVLRLAGPISLQALLTSLMHILDNAMVAGLGSDAPFAGVGQANKVTFLLQVIMFGMVSGASIFTAQYWGKRDLPGIHRTMGLGLVTALSVALLFFVPVMAAPEAIMRLLIVDAEAAAYGAQYLRIIAFVYLLDAVLMVYEAVLRSTEHVILPTIAGTAAICTNTFLNYCLIYGNFGLPRLEVRGAAVATLIGVGVQVTILISASYLKKFPSAIHPRDLRLPERAVIRKYFRTVAPVMLNEGLWSLGVVMYSAAYGRMGVSASAAANLFESVQQLAYVTLRGTTSACAILVGKAIGAGCLDEAQRIAKRILSYAMILCAGIGLLVVLFAGNIVSLFSVSDAVAQNTRGIIRVFGLTMWISGGCSTLIVGVLRAGGDVVCSGVIDVVFLWLVGVPLVWIFGPGLGWPVVMVYLLTKVEEILKLVFSLRRLRSRKWIHNLVEDS